MHVKRNTTMKKVILLTFGVALFGMLYAGSWIKEEATTIAQYKKNHGLRQKQRVVKKVENQAAQLAKHKDEHKKFAQPRKKTYMGKAGAKEFLAERGVKYLDENEIRVPALLRMDMTQTSRYQRDVQEAANLTKIYGAKIAKSYRPALSVRFISKNVGVGVFAEQDLQPGDFLGEYTGVVMHRDDVHGKDYTWEYPVITEDNRRVSLDAKNKGNELMLVNHGNDPNVKVKYILGTDGLWHICYLVIRPIKKGQQVLVSYGSKYWKARASYFKDLQA